MYWLGIYYCFLASLSFEAYCTVPKLDYSTVFNALLL